MPLLIKADIFSMEDGIFKMEKRAGDGKTTPKEIKTALEIAAVYDRIGLEAFIINCKRKALRQKAFNALTRVHRILSFTELEWGSKKARAIKREHAESEYKRLCKKHKLEFQE